MRQSADETAQGFGHAIYIKKCFRCGYAPWALLMGIIADIVLGIVLHFTKYDFMSIIVAMATPLVLYGLLVAFFQLRIAMHSKYI